MRTTKFIIKKWNKFLTIGMPSKSNFIEDDDQPYFCTLCGHHWIKYADRIWCYFGHKYNATIDNTVGSIYHGEPLNFWNDNESARRGRI